MGRGDHQRNPERADRLALVRWLAGRQRRLRPLHSRDRRTRHRRQSRPSLRPARRRRRRDDRETLWTGSRASGDGRSPDFQAADGSRRDPAGDGVKAVCWYGKGDVRVEQVRDPTIVTPRDAILRVTSTAICGSDRHLYGGYVSTMMNGDLLVDEFTVDGVEDGCAIRSVKG